MKSPGKACTWVQSTSSAAPSRSPASAQSRTGRESSGRERSAPSEPRHTSGYPRRNSAPRSVRSSWRTTLPSSSMTPTSAPGRIHTARGPGPASRVGGPPSTSSVTSRAVCAKCSSWAWSSSYAMPYERFTSTPSTCSASSAATVSTPTPCRGPRGGWSSTHATSGRRPRARSGTPPPGPTGRISQSSVESAARTSGSRRPPGSSGIRASGSRRYLVSASQPRYASSVLIRRRPWRRSRHPYDGGRADGRGGSTADARRPAARCRRAAGGSTAGGRPPAQAAGSRSSAGARTAKARSVRAAGSSAPSLSLHRRSTVSKATSAAPAAMRG